MTTVAWYLVCTKPQRERVALLNLERQGYSAFLPLIKLNKRRRGKYCQVEEPMFSRYLFIRLDRENDNWSPIRSTLGVANIVRFGMIPARVPDDLIEALQRRANQLSDDSETEPLFAKGDAVKLMEGPFAGYEAIFQATKSDDRVIVLLEIANRYTKLKIKADLLEKI